MSNVLKVSHQTAINSLKVRGWSDRRIARELGLNRRTVVRYGAKCTTQVTSGSEGLESKCTTEVTSGKEENAGSILASLKEEPKAPIQSRSVCAAYEGIIEPKIQAGLSAQRIYQDLVLEAGFSASYQSVKRYVGQRKAADPKRIWRIEVEPGEEVQVDFGLAVCRTEKRAAKAAFFRVFADGDQILVLEESRGEPSRIFSGFLLGLRILDGGIAPIRPTQE